MIGVHLRTDDLLVKRMDNVAAEKDCHVSEVCVSGRVDRTMPTYLSESGCQGIYQR